MGAYKSNNLSPESVNELSELKHFLRKQQAQLDAILKHLSLTPSNTSGGVVGSHPGAAHFQADGKSICMHCNKVGHIARFCRSDLVDIQLNQRGRSGTGQAAITGKESNSSTGYPSVAGKLAPSGVKGLALEGSFSSCNVSSDELLL